MSARPDLAGVLADHYWGDDTSMVGYVAMQCGCGWKSSSAQARIYALRARHDQHRAAALNAAIDAWLADEGTREAVGEAVAASGANYLTGDESSRLYDAYRFGDDAVRLQDVTEDVARRAAEQGATAALAALTNPTTTEPEEGKR